MERLEQPQTVQELLQWAALFLGKDKRIEAELLLTKVSGYSRAKLLAYPEAQLTTEAQELFTRLVKLRREGEPLQYLLGTQDFMGLDFLVNRNVLIPRSDTEVLVERAIAIGREIPHLPLRILDLCTGSGAIAISLAKFLPKAQVTGVDISYEALQVAQANIKLNKADKKVQLLQGDLYEPVGEGSYHMITANPPYITTEEMHDLPIDVQKEPALALWGGDDGLDFYRKIITKSRQYLEPLGWLLLEIGWQQGDSVKRMLEDEGFIKCQIIKDWSGHDRVVEGQYPGSKGF